MHTLYGWELPTKEELEHLFLFRGMSVPDIGRKYGISVYYVNKCLRIHKILIPVLKKPSKEELEHLYMAGTLSVSDVGREFGISVYYVTKWLNEYKIPKRPHLYYRKSAAPHRAKLHTFEDRPIKARRKSTCGILKDHARDLNDDPERLSTKFLQKIIGVKCD